MHWRPSDGLQSETPIYQWDGRRVNAGWVTTFNEYAVVSENRLTTIPKDFDLRLAPLFGCAVTTAMGVVNNDAHSLPLHFKKVLTGSHGGSAEPHVDIPRYIRLCQAGKMRLDGLITHEFGLDQINEAIEVVRSGGAGRCVVSMS